MKKIRIIHTNDIHSKFEPFIQMSFVINSLKTGKDILLDGGDFNDYSDITTYGTNGYAGLTMLNKLGYDATVIGNNEGFQEISTIEDICNSKLVNILSINLVKEDKNKIKGLQGSIIKEIDGERFLIIGISPYKESYELYYKFYNIHSLSPYELILNEMKEKEGQYDFVIVLSHIGLQTDIKLTQYIKGVDLIVSAHTHTVTDLINSNGVYIHQSGVRGSHVGYIDLEIENHKICKASGENIPIDSNTNKNQEIERIYKDFNKKAIERLSSPIAYINEDLHFKVSEESNLTNLLCDYLYNHYKGDFSLINTGLTEKDILKGNVSTLDVLNSCNSPIHVNTIKIKGKYILEALQESTDIEKCKENKRRPGFRGVFLGKLQVSHNCIVKTNNNSVELLVNNKPIDPEGYYQVITTDYFYNGRGYESLGNNEGYVGYKEPFSDILIKALNDKESLLKINEFRWR